MKRILFDRVLCAVDFSPGGEAVLKRALVLADAHGAAVDVVHVLDAGPKAATSDSAVASIVRQVNCDVLVVPQRATALFATAAGALGRLPTELVA